MKIELTKDNKEYIRANRFKQTATDMSKEIKVPFPTVTRFMKDNGLEITQEEKNNIRQIKKENKVEVPWGNTKEFWCINWLVGRATL